MRKKIVAGNWKMNLNYLEGVSLFSEISNMAKDELTNNQQLIICSPFIHLQSLVQLSKGYENVSIGAQNCHSEEKGAYTGEVSASQLHSIGVEYVILGHSERRLYFQEDNQLLEKKVALALKNNLKVIYCIGETLEERESQQYLKVIAEQLKSVLGGLNPQVMKNVVIAYEPVWAIGTGKTASPEQAQEVHAYIREQISSLFDAQLALETSILYGGSCNPTNAESLFSQADIDGGLIGGASLKSRDFLDIAKTFNSL